VDRSRHDLETKWRPTVAGVLLAGPMAGALLAASHAGLLHTGRLTAGSPDADALLLAVSLAVAVASLALTAWQHRTIVRPLRRLADGGDTGCTTAAREIVALGRRLEPQPPRIERDGLTGLLSASGMHTAGAAVLETVPDAGSQFLLLVVDIARLRDINGMHGFGFGDDLLRQFARRLGSVTDGPATVARMGGDRFALLVANPAGTAMAGATAGLVTDALARPFQVMGCEVAMRLHTGVALYPDHAGSFDRLLRAAELALESARRADSRWRLFDPQLNQAAVARKTLERELKRALEDGQLRLYYQPQVDLVAGQVLAVEALLRWQHPERGIVAPQTFIPVAEASGLIRPIGAWVLAEACRAARRWHDQGIPVGISVNVSAAQLKHQDLAGIVAQALAASRLPADVLELELTESMFVDPAELVVHRAVQAIAAMGVRLAIDDFGTGYSSLGYLKRLPVHKIKIDKSFVRELGRDDADAAIVRSIISLAQTFGKRVLAEGIEEASQYRYLAAEGCHEGQGYYFARPMPEAACTEFLAEHARPAAAAATPRLLAC
jgi:diguanylate cyclase (GGDEF)-like protein